MSQQCDVHFLLHGADKPCVDEVKSTLASLEADWGVAPKVVQCDHFDDPHTMGATNNVRTKDGLAPGEDVRLADNYMASFKGWQRKIKEYHPMISKAVLGFTEDHPAGYCIMHEYGHVLHAALYGEMKPEQKITGVLSAVGLSAAGVMPEMPPDIDPRRMPADVAQITTLTWMFQAFPKSDMQKLSDDLSPYATFSPPEMVAEAFVRDRLYPGTSKTATAIMQFIRHDFERKFGRPAPAIAA